MATPEPLEQMPKYVSVNTAAKILGIAPVTTRRRIKEGSIPSWQPGGERTRILIPSSALSPDEASSKTQSSQPVKDTATPRRGRRINWKKNQS